MTIQPHFGGCLPHLIAIPITKNRLPKTAEERFHMLARGWLAYPVTPVAHTLPPKSGCINTHMYTIINIQNKNRRSAVV